MSRSIGARAEDAACAFLESLGFVILARNYAIRGAEVDIVAKEGDIVAFVEVKYRKTVQNHTPRESVTPAKQKRVAMAALAWLCANGTPEAAVRFDVVESVAGGMALLRGAFSYRE